MKRLHKRSVAHKKQGKDKELVQIARTKKQCGQVNPFLTGHMPHFQK